jgi:hypothetical protein
MYKLIFLFRKKNIANLLADTRHIFFSHGFLFFRYFFIITIITITEHLILLSEFYIYTFVLEQTMLFVLLLLHFAFLFYCFIISPFYGYSHRNAAGSYQLSLSEN